MSHNLEVYMNVSLALVCFLLSRFANLFIKILFPKFPQFLYLLNSSRTQQYQGHKYNVCIDFIYSAKFYATATHEDVNRFWVYSGN